VEAPTLAMGRVTVAAALRAVSSCRSRPKVADGEEKQREIRKIEYIHPIDMWAPLVGATSVHSQRPRQHPERVWTSLDLDNTRSQVRGSRNDILEVEGPR
jgi:hypothetical protein